MKGRRRARGIGALAKLFEGHHDPQFDVFVEHQERGFVLVIFLIELGGDLSDAGDILDHLLAHEIFGGYKLENDYPELKNCLMLAVTEKISREDIDYLCEVLEEVNHG